MFSLTLQDQHMVSYKDTSTVSPIFTIVSVSTIVQEVDSVKGQYNPFVV
jgi:hypothetical protein